MAEPFLSQEEIDALLDASAAEAAQQTPQSMPEPPPVEPYDLARQERIVRGRMPALELIHERFSRNLRIGLFNFMRRNPEVSADPVVVGKYGSFMSGLMAPSSINVMQIKPPHGSALLILEPELVASIVDIMFGGTGRPPVALDGREPAMLLDPKADLAAVEDRFWPPAEWILPLEIDRPKLERVDVTPFLAPRRDEMDEL